MSVIRGGGGGGTTGLRRPVLRYHGGKWRLAPWIIQHMPKHEVYVEPFGGAASVLLRKQPSRIEVYNDLDESVVNLFRILRDPARAAALRQAVSLTPFSRREFAACWEVSEDPIEEARRLIVRSFQALGNKHRLSRNGWRTRTAKAKWSPCVSWNGWPEQIPEFVGRLRDVIIEAMDWEKLLRVYDDPATLWYVDPPYVHETRAAGHTEMYVSELTNEDHSRLLDRLKAAKGMVMLSGYAHPLYEKALRGWRRRERPARAQTNVPRTEVLWMNPACAAALVHEERQTRLLEAIA
jgi:DNA adenine methylase